MTHWHCTVFGSCALRQVFAAASYRIGTTIWTCGTALHLGMLKAYEDALLGCRGQSIGSEWDLLCGQAWKVQLPNFAFFVGQLAGTALFGELADAVGKHLKLLLFSKDSYCNCLSGITPACLRHIKCLFYQAS